MQPPRRLTRAPSRVAWLGLGLGLGLASSLSGVSRAESLPLIEAVDFQPLSAQVRRVVEALDMLGQPLPEAVKQGIARAERSTDRRAAVKAIQQALDEHCLIGVSINPESRVKAKQGPAPAILMQHGWRVFLVKVQNEAGVTAELRADSPNAAPLYRRSSSNPEPRLTIPPSEVPLRWMDVDLVRDRPMKATLSGLEVEYALLRVYSRDAGR